MPRILRRTHLVSAVTACFAALSLQPALAVEPVVKGPESVEDWYNAGQDFVRDSERVVANHRTAKNVILFVGDGLGISTITAARILDGQMHGKPGEENRLFFETLPNVALSKTYSWDQQTSDSAPTMTAMVTGYKAREGMLSVNHTTARGECDPDAIAARSLPTILEQAAAAGKDTGVVTTARVTHATPAATYAHTAVRDWEADSNLPAGCGVKDIARQLIEAGPAVRKSLKVVLGGGRDYFRKVDQADPEYPTKKGLRKDGRDLTEEWVGTRGKGARYVWNKAGFDAADPDSTPYLLGLFERSHVQYEADRANDPAGEPSLTEMTEKAIRMLDKNQKGFFLHVEAGRIDHAHHAGNAKRALLDTIELANAVKKAYEMTDPHETLIVVTADHSHVFTIAGYPHRGNDILGLTREVPNVDGNTPVPTRDKLGLPYTTLGYQNGPGWRDAIATGQKRPNLNGVDTTALDYLQEAAVPLSSETHAGEDVAIFASGPKAYLVRGVMEQNWIYHVMRDAFGL
ncbi:alkaline phosphatase [Azoarcus sp. DN11]|uniref:alkaline phosphatase n=1 Tax=Azoarcus sp. DN11 TaxID=356837 RepID=UPI000EB198CB|nr:alkaline phosphatase [Azoarcus sp. DN11]AYH43008.1 alkaline phosphatase [Azoarcus sp. DN11]